MLLTGFLLIVVIANVVVNINTVAIEMGSVEKKQITNYIFSKILLIFCCCYVKKQSGEQIREHVTQSHVVAV